jgi:CRISPR system Cascade subunit CasB
MSEPTRKTDAAFEWWQAHIADRDSGKAKGLAARLRRAEGIEVLAEPAVHALARRLGYGPRDAQVVIRLAQVLAHVRGDRAESLARRVGGSEPKLSQLRFQRLLRTPIEELPTTLIRTLPFAGHTCNVINLVRVIQLWDHEPFGDEARARWAFDYFGADRATHDNTNDTLEHTEA